MAIRTMRAQLLQAVGVNAVEGAEFDKLCAGNAETAKINAVGHCIGTANVLHTH